MLIFDVDVRFVKCVPDFPFTETVGNAITYLNREMFHFLDIYDNIAVLEKLSFAAHSRQLLSEFEFVHEDLLNTLVKNTYVPPIFFPY